MYPQGNVIVSPYKTSLDSRPIKVRPGTYCRGDSARALHITQNMGNRTTKVKPLESILRICSVILYLHDEFREAVALLRWCRRLEH